jgi:hypothetical protein
MINNINIKKDSKKALLNVNELTKGFGSGISCFDGAFWMW